MSNPKTLLTAAGVAWGIFETLQHQWHTAGGPASARHRHEAAGHPPIPPLPRCPRFRRGMRDDALRIVRLAISAGTPMARSANRNEPRLEQARRRGGPTRRAGVGAAPALADIVAGVTDDTQRGTLYVLAFGILRGDEQPTGADVSIWRNSRTCSDSTRRRFSNSN